MKNLSNENVIHIYENGVSYLKFRKLLQYEDIVHCFTLKPWDFAYYSVYEERKASAQKSLREAAAVLGIEDYDFVRPCQTHSKNIKAVGKNDKGIYPGFLADTDGLITSEKGKALLLGFGDCTPLLFYDPVKNIIANIHSGWRGTLQKIALEAVRMLIGDYGCNPSDIICCIGPHIRKCHFEVDTDVYEMFLNGYSDFDDFSSFVRYEDKRNKYFIDTTGLNIRLLKNAGLRDENIIDSGICTVCECGVCHSYRAEKKLSGRSAAIIALKK